MTDKPVVDAITALKADIATLQAGSAGAPVDVTTSTLTATVASHAGRVVTLSRAAGVAVTLPAASGSGAKFQFLVKTTVTTPSTTIKVANSSDAFIGFSNIVSDDPAACKGFIAAALSDDTVTLNGTTTGGYAGDLVTLEDVAANVWAVRVFGKATGTEATPFSATV
jgi:hypothetical protein